jgi:hypothetical protein
MSWTLNDKGEPVDWTKHTSGVLDFRLPGERKLTGEEIKKRLSEYSSIHNKRIRAMAKGRP